MVCRDAFTHKSRPVNPLLLETEDEKALFARGKGKPWRIPTNSTMTRFFSELRERRQKRLAEALDRVPPSSGEATLLHNMHLKYRSDVQPMHPVDGIEPVPIRDTRMENTLMMYPQERNVHSKVFGGSLNSISFILAY
jgi:acyl-coenzyme A thioesterase 9